MRVGVVTELKADEYRVALTPAGARELVERGHEVLVETGAGEGSAFPDAAYESVGARLVSVDEVWTESELVLKVKEPLRAEYGRLREGLTLFTYLHLAADETLTNALVASGATCIAYETVQTAVRGLKGDLPDGMRPKNSRYIGSLVADFHRNLIAGGVFLYPADTRNTNGKLRLLYEASPMAFIAEQAQGSATDGLNRILDIVPTHLHQRTPLVIGSREDVGFVADMIRRVTTSSGASGADSQPAP